MLKAKEVNCILDAFFQEIEGRMPDFAPFQLGTAQAVTNGGAQGSFICAALFSGAYQGKLTFILETDAALALAGSLLQTELESLTTEAQTELQGVFYQSLQSISNRFAQEGTPIEIYPLPLLINTNALLAEDPNTPILKLPLIYPKGECQLFLAFK